MAKKASFPNKDEFRGDIKTQFENKIDKIEEGVRLGDFDLEQALSSIEEVVTASRKKITESNLSEVEKRSYNAIVTRNAQTYKRAVREATDRYKKTIENQESMDEMTVDLQETVIADEDLAELNEQDPEKAEKGREEILGRLDEALELIKNIDPQTPRLKWIIKSIESGKNKLGDDGKIEISDGSFKQKEGIPVDDLIEELESMAQKIQNDISATKKRSEIKKLETQKEKLTYLADFLLQKSEKYFEVHKEMKDGTKQHPRTEHEALLISNDYRNTGDKDKDYELAMETMTKRRELILPAIQAEEKTTEAGTETTEKKDESEATKEATEATTETLKTPETPAEEKQKSKEVLYIINIEDVVEAMARRQAETKLEELKHRGRITAWWVRMTEDGYLKKFQREALEAIKGNHNLMATIDARIRGKGEVDKGRKKDKSTILLDSIIEECKQDITNSTELIPSVLPDVNLELAKILKDYSTGVEGLTDREGFDQRIENDIIPLLEKHHKAAKGGDMYASNLFALAESHKEAIKKLIEDEVKKGDKKNQEENILKQIQAEMALDIKLAERQRDLQETKPEGTLRWYEKFVNWTQDIPILGRLAANPVAAALVGSLAGKTGSRMLIGAGVIAATGATAGLAAVGTAAVFGGAYAMWRRSRDFKHDRGMDLRRRTLGAESGGSRTDKMREFAYSQLNAETLVAKLGEFQTPSNQAAAIKLIAEIEARLQVGEERHVDLISVSAEKGEEFESNIPSMLELHKAIKDAKTRTGIVDGMYRGKTNEETAKLNKEITKKDKQANRARYISSAWAGATGAVIGVAVGAVAQEAYHALGYHSGQQTAIDALRNWWHDGSTHGAGAVEHITHPGTILETIQGASGHEAQISIPEGFHIEKIDDCYNLVNADNKVVIENLDFDEFMKPDGTVDTDDLNQLFASHHVPLTIHENGVREITAQQTLKPEDYIKNQAERFHKVHRTLWYDNNTSKPIFEKNELGIRWGGDKGMGVDTKGNYVFNVKKMSADGSFHGKFSVDAQKAMAEGKLKMLFSLSEKTQGQVFEVPIDADGNAVINPDSEMAKILFQTDEHGHAIFNGKFAEVAQDLGSKDGVDQVAVLATEEGNGIASIDIDQVVQPTYQFDEVIDITKPGEPAPTGFEAPLVFPFARRKSLESAKKRAAQPAVAEQGDKKSPAPEAQGSATATEGKATGRQPIVSETQKPMAMSEELVAEKEKFHKLIENLDFKTREVEFKNDEKEKIKEWLINMSSDQTKIFFSFDSRKEDISKLQKLAISAFAEDSNQDTYQNWKDFTDNESIGAYGAAVALAKNYAVIEIIREQNEDLANEIEEFKKLNADRTVAESVADSDKVTFGDFNVDYKTGEDAANEAKINEAFKKKIREVWDKFVVHGQGGTHGRLLKEESDLDGEGAIMLLELAGFQIERDAKTGKFKNVEYVPKGETRKGFVVDTGNIDGIEYENGSLSADHHGDQSDRDSSATRYVYEILNDYDLLDNLEDEEKEALDRMVEFITQADNCNYPNFAEHYDDSGRSILGLWRLIKIDKLWEWFQNNPDEQPHKPLEDAELRELGISKTAVDNRIKDIENAPEKYAELEADGFVIESPTYGRILVDRVGQPNEKLPTGIDGAIALGVDCYIAWTYPDSFMISFINKEIKPEHEKALREKVPGAERVRSMFAKFLPKTSENKNGKEGLKVTIEDVLNILTDGDFEAKDDDLGKEIENEKEDLAKSSQRRATQKIRPQKARDRNNGRNRKPVRTSPGQRRPNQSSRKSSARPKVEVGA